MSQAKTLGVHHIGFTVPDIQATRAFFVDVLGFQQVGEKPDYPAVFVSDGTTMLTLWQVKDASSAVAFDRRCNVGLHHFALRVADDATLDQLCEVMQAHEQVELEFAPELLGASGLRHMMCLIPGGVRLELIAA